MSGCLRHVVKEVKRSYGDSSWRNGSWLNHDVDVLGVSFKWLGESMVIVPGSITIEIYTLSSPFKSLNTLIEYLSGDFA